MQIDLNYVLIPIINHEQVEELRKIRNSCKDYMTRNNKEITGEEQISWFNSLGNDIKLFLLSEVYHGIILIHIGYGLLKIENDKILLSGGLHETSRNKGVGKLLFEKLIYEAEKYNLPIMLEVLSNNIRARKVYESLGFKYSDLDKEILTMVYDND